MEPVITAEMLNTMLFECCLREADLVAWTGYTVEGLLAKHGAAKALTMVEDCCDNCA